MIIIVGASAGIGEGTAVHFAKLGSRLSLAGRSADNLSRVALLCREQGLSENDVREIILLHDILPNTQSMKYMLHLRNKEVNNWYIRQRNKLV